MNGKVKLFDKQKLRNFLHKIQLIATRRHRKLSEQVASTNKDIYIKSGYLYKYKVQTS